MAVTTRREPCGHCGRHIVAVGNSCPGCGGVAECLEFPEPAKLEVAISALRRIVESDPGPAYHIAKAALEEIEGM